MAWHDMDRQNQWKLDPIHDRDRTRNYGLTKLVKIRLKLEMIAQASQCNGVNVSWIDTDNFHWTKLVKIRPELEMIKKTADQNQT